MSVDYAIGLFAGAGELNAPTADGTAGQVIQTDGSGQLSFGDAVGGVSGDIQYNNGGVLGGFGDYDGTTLNTGGAVFVSNNTTDGNVIGQLVVDYFGSNNPEIRGVGGTIVLSSGLEFKSLSTNVTTAAGKANDLVFTHGRSGDYGFAFQTRLDNGTVTTRLKIGGGNNAVVQILNSIVKLVGLPTSDPVVADQLWNDGGTLKISAG